MSKHGGKNSAQGINPTISNTSPKSSNNNITVSNEERHENIRESIVVSTSNQGLLPTPAVIVHNTGVAETTTKINYTDQQLVDFFKQPDGDRFLQREIKRKPVHILADFNYVPLNFDLEETGADEPAGLAAQKDSGSAKMWRRNSDARVWRDWVANCIMFENYVGEENPKNAKDPRTYRVDSTGNLDRMNIGLYARHPVIRSYNEEQTESRTGMSACFQKILEVYAMLYQIDEYVIQAVNAQPRQTQWNKVAAIDIGKVRVMARAAWKDNLKADKYIEFINRIVWGSNYVDRSIGSTDYESLKHNFRFNTFDDRELSFKFDKSDHWQFFIKSSSESIRNINHYIEEMKFVHNDVSGARFRSGKNVYSGASTMPVVSDFIEYDIYSSALKIRRKILRAKSDFKYASADENPNLDIKSPRDTAGTFVISQGRILSSGKVDDVIEDDVQKIFARTKSIKKNNQAVTFAPFLINDALEKSGSLIMHFMTIRDVLILKKSQLLALIDNIKNNLGNADFDRKVEILKAFPFENGPESLVNLSEKLIDKMCPIRGTVIGGNVMAGIEYSIDAEAREKEALVLLDPRNIVSHITKRRVGRYIYNSALLASHYAHQGSSSRGTKLSNYSLGVFKSNAFNRASRILLGNSANSNSVSVFTQNLSTGQDIPAGTTAEGGTVGATVAAGGQLGDDINSLINGTVIGSMSIDAKRKYIFFVVLIQLSERYNDVGSPFFSHYYSDIAYSQAANALYSQYHEKIEDNSWVRDFNNPKSVFFEENKAFTRFTLNQKIGLMNQMNEDVVREGFDNSSLVSGLFSNVSNLVDRVDELPRNRDRALAQYRRNIIRTVEAGTGMSPNSEGFVHAVSRFFGRADAQENYAGVVQDFLFTSEGGYNPGATEQEYEYQGRARRNSEGQPAEGRPQRTDATAAETNARTIDNMVMGVRGIGAGGPKETAGFASLNLNEGVKQSAINKLRSQVLNLDRDDNFLIMLAEAICAQLFYGYPTQENIEDGQNLSDIFEKIEGKSSFNDNPLGIFRGLGLVTNAENRQDEKIVNMSDEDLFDVVWEYVKIAEIFTKELPKVKLKFKQVQNSNQQELVSSGYYDVRGAQSSYDRTSTYSDNVTRTLRTFTTEGGSQAELAYQLNEYVARANDYFKIAEDQLSKEPVFRLAVEPINNSIDEWTAFAIHTRSGFLPHVSLNSPFQRQKIQLCSADAAPHGIASGGTTLEKTDFLYKTTALVNRSSYRDFLFSCVPKRINFRDKLSTPRVTTAHRALLDYNLGEKTTLNFSSDTTDTFFGYSCVPVFTENYAYRNLMQNSGDFADLDETKGSLHHFFSSRVGLLPVKWYNELLEKMPLINDLVESSQVFRGRMDNFTEDNSSDWVQIYPLTEPIVKIITRIKFDIKLKKKTYTFAHALRCTPTEDRNMGLDGDLSLAKELPESMRSGPRHSHARFYGNGRTYNRGFRNDYMYADWRFGDDHPSGGTAAHYDSFGGPVTVSDVNAVEDYRRGNKNARWTMANLFLALSHYDNLNGGLTDIGQTMSSTVEGFQEQYEYAKMFYSDLKDDPAVIGWGHQVWDWVRPYPGGNWAFGFDRNPEKGGRQGGWSARWLDGNNNQGGQPPPNRNTGWYSQDGYNPPNPRNPSESAEVGDLIPNWILEYTGYHNPSSAVPEDWIWAYEDRGPDDGIVRVDDGLKAISTVARQVFLGKAEGFSDEDIEHNKITAADVYYRKDIASEYYPYPDDLDDVRAGRFYPEFKYLNSGAPTEYIGSEGAANTVTAYLYFTGQGGSNWTHYSPDLVYKDGSGQMGTLNPTLGFGADVDAEATYLPDYVKGFNISGTQPFYDRSLDWYKNNLHVVLPLGTMALDYMVNEINEGLEFDGNGNYSGDGQNKEYAINEFVTGEGSATQYYNSYGLDAYQEWMEAPWSRSMYLRVERKIEAEKVKAKTFFTNMLAKITELTAGTSRFNQRKARATVAQLPYCFFWKEDHPYFEITAKREWTEDYTPPEIAVVPKWGNISRNVDAQSFGTWSNYTHQNSVNNIDSLERQYYQYLYAQKQYAELYREVFDLSMSTYEKIAKDLKNAPQGKTNQLAVEQISKIGFVNVTPEVLDNYNALRIRAMTHGYDGNDGSQESWYLPYGPGGRKKLSIVPGFKLTPFAPPNNHGAAANEVKSPHFGSKHNQLNSYKKAERWFHELGLINSQNTRVCFVGIETGELTRILSAPDDLDDLDEAATQGHFSLFGDGDFEIQLELFDYFRPWIVLKFDPKERSPETKVLNFSRGKIIKIATNWDSQENQHSRVEDILARFNEGISVSSLGSEVSNSNRGLADSLGYLRGGVSRVRKGYSDEVETLSAFLKIYANHVLGLNFFEYTIPYLNSHAPVGDYFPDRRGELPEERNYQEPMRESLAKIVATFKGASNVTENAQTGPQHLLKYFYDRTRIDEASTPFYSHFDEIGRQDLFKFDDLSNALFAKDAVDLESKIFYPFKFEQPITKRSLAAAEILTSVNEVFSNVEEVLEQFEHGFVFDHIVGLTYKLDDFVLQKNIRKELDGSLIDIPGEIELIDGQEIKDFSLIREGLPYLNSIDGRVKINSMYPLTLRAKIKKAGSSN